MNILSIFSIALIFHASACQASGVERLYWDTADAPGLQGGNGTWSVEAKNWNVSAEGAGPRVAWRAGMTAVFRDPEKCLVLAAGPLEVGGIEAAALDLAGGAIGFPARPETLITALSGRSCRDESQLNFSSECGSRLAETGDGEGRIRGIENPIQRSPTGFHAGGELSLGDVFLFQDLLKLESHHTLEGEDFDFGTNSLICEEVAKITSAMDVLVCFGFHFRCSFM